MKEAQYQHPEIVQMAKEEEYEEDDEDEEELDF